MAREDLFLLEEMLQEEPVDPLTIPSIRQRVTHERRDDELGLRALLKADRDSNAMRRPPATVPAYRPRRFPKYRRRSVA